MVRLGVDVGGTAVKWVLLDGEAVAGSGAVPTPAGPREVVELVAGLVGEKAEAVGVGLPGHVDRASGTALFVPNALGDWAGFPVGRELESLTGVPVAVVNDAQAFALAELRLGAARGLSDVLFTVLGTGVGGAVALEGKILAGPRDNLGEIGHVTVDPEGPECGCGNRGCAETFAAGPVIAQRFGAGTAAAVAEAARAGDGCAVEVMSRAGWALGVAIGDVMAVLGISTVVVGGGVAGAFDLMRPDLEAVLRRRKPLIGEATVLPAVLGPLAGAIGAALLLNG